MLFEELGRALCRGPFFSTIALDAAGAARRPKRGGREPAKRSWTLAIGPLVPDLDTATRVAIVGGDGIYELEG